MEGKKGVAQPGDPMGSGTWTRPHGSAAIFTSRGCSSSGERSCVNVARGAMGGSCWPSWECCRNAGRVRSRGLSPPNAPGPDPEPGMLLEGHNSAFAQPGNARAQAAQGTGALGRDCVPSHNAALTRVFFIPTEGTVSADDLCHTPVLSGM